MKISFAHNVQNRHKTLRETIEMELKYFPNAKIYVAYNGENFNLNYFNDIENIEFIKYVGHGHKIGCVNGCITSIQTALKDDSDIIIFSHDDVKINPTKIDIVFKNIQEILNKKYDIICRRPHSFGENYYMMEVFFLNKKTANEIFNNLKLLNGNNELPKDIKNSPSPEVWLYNIINNSGANINEIDYMHFNNNYNLVLSENLGFIHKNAGLRGWND